MGMDVSGNNPTDETGEYFRNSIWWWWHPLADYCAAIAPDIASRCQDWHHNDGDGLGSDDSRALADVLQREINSGRCEAYAKIREAELATLPNRLCDYCAGAGELTPPTALLSLRVRCGQYKISKIKLSISMIAVTPATESINASLASW